MRLDFHLPVLLFLGALLASRAAALEVNYWPVFTGERDAEGEFRSREMIGPVLFKTSTESEDIYGIRPLFVRFKEKDRDAGSFHLLYPLFNVRHRPYGTSWDFFSLLRYQSFEPEATEATRTFHLFPFLFWQRHPDPDRSYFGVFPIAGNAQNVLLYDEVDWVLFPLWARMTRGETTTTAMPWPFIRFVRGPDTRGFHLWPLYGQVAREDVSSHRYWLWPLGYHVRRDLWKEEPFEAFGMLPFYSSSSSDSAVSQTFIWPFFGYTDSHNPEYFETRYFWPLLVQRRGDSYVNRWAPVYTRSIRSGVDTRWVMWPFHRYSTWEERGLRNERTQFLYFLYWSNTQSSVEDPELDPAVKQHVWPFYSYWDNGAGRRQFQALSPFEVFFPFNDVVRAKYSPLFAIYRRDTKEGVFSRQSFLFNFITTRREWEEEIFHLDIGPLFSYEQSPQAREWELFKGLLSYSRQNDERSFGAFWLNRPGDTGTGGESEQSGPANSQTTVRKRRAQPGRKGRSS